MNEPADPIRRIAYITQALGVTPRCIYSRIARGKFPAPTIFDGRNGWHDSVIVPHLSMRSETVAARSQHVTA